MLMATAGKCEPLENTPNKKMQTENSPPSVVDRYYTRSCVSVTTESGKNNDVCVLTHSNRICIITLSPNNAILQEKKVVKNVDFKVSEGMNRLDNHVTGKFKKGGQWLKPKSPLCRIVCEDGDEFVISSGAAGKLVEANERLVTMPQLLTSKPETEGYIAIVMPELQDSRRRQGNWHKKRN